jgi:hypothetical protein
MGASGWWLAGLDGVREEELLLTWLRG